MLYVQESLLRNEKLVFISRPHWVVFGPSVGVFILACILWYYLPQYIGHQPIWHHYSAAALFGAVVVFGGLIMFLKAFLFFTTSEYAVTDRRVVMKMGWLSRDAIEVFLQRIEALNVSQTLLGRLLNYGTVVVIGTGGTSDYYPNVPDPLRFHRIVQKQMNELLERSKIPEMVD